MVNETKLQLLMASSYIILPIFIISFNEEKIFKLLLIIVFTILLRNYYIQVQSTYKSLENTFNSYDLVIKKAIDTKEKNRYMIIGNIDTKTNINKLNYGYISDLGIFWDEYNLRKIAFTKFVKYYGHKKIEFVDVDTYNSLLNDKYDKIINHIDDIVIIDFDNI